MENTPPAATSDPLGVWFDRSDYAGFWQRLAIDLLDAFVLLFYWIAAFAIVWAISPAHANGIYFLVAAAGAFAYLVLLKRWGKTLGYLIGNAEVVNLHGKPPSLLALTIRAAFIFLGPGNTLLDLLWLTGDRHRQALRDKFARTYVIKRGRLPAGTGRIRYVRLDMLGYNLLLPEVAIDAPDAKVPASGQGSF